MGVTPGDGVCSWSDRPLKIYDRQILLTTGDRDFIQGEKRYFGRHCLGGVKYERFALLFRLGLASFQLNAGSIAQSGEAVGIAREKILPAFAVFQFVGTGTE